MASPTDTALGVVTTQYAYSDFGELESMTASVSGSPVFATSYLRDRLGRITTKVETIEGVTTTYVYGYDTAGRLDTVTIDGTLEADYDYDLNGNRLQKWTPSATETGTYDDQDRMQSYGGATYTYTRNGELLTKADPEGTTTYGYDVFGNLLGVDLPDGTQIDYVVDARNRRIGREENGAWTQKLLWQGQLSPIAELDAANNVVSRFVYATRINVPDYMIRGGQTYRILHDHLGSPRLVVDASSGEIVQRVVYDEWGVLLQDNGTSMTPFSFAGGLHDLDTRIIRFGMRDFSQSAGRWTVTDPVRFNGRTSNLYSYAEADPLNRQDAFGLYSPEGHFSITLMAALGAGLSLRDSLRLAWDVAAADFEPSIKESQATANSHWHAMCGPMDSPSDCQRRYEELLNDGILGADCNQRASLAQLLHALQDSFAWGHKGFQEYNGSLLDLPLHHLIGDWVPTAPSRADALFASGALLANNHGGAW